MPLPTVHRLSVTAAAFGGEPRQVAQRSRQLGFRGLVFDCYGTVNLTELSMSGRRDWLRGLTQNDQDLVGLQIDLGRDGLGLGADVERQLQRIRRALETSAELKAGVLCIELGLLPRVRQLATTPKAISPEMAGAIILPSPHSAPAVAPDVLPPPDPTFVAQVQYALSDIGSMADRTGVAVALSSGLSSLRSLQSAIAPLGCPWFGVDLDPVAILRDGASIDEAFSLVGSAISHVRLRDAIVGDDHRTRPVVLGSGNVAWVEFLAALEAAGYAGPMTVDPADLNNRSAAAVEGLAFITQLAKKI